MSISVDVVREPSPWILAGINQLLPQLSKFAQLLTSADLNALVSNEGVSLLVATQGDDIVGTLTLATFRIPTGMRAWIEDVVVDQNARGLGIGGALCMRALEIARDKGAKTVELTSRPSRGAANALYVKLGFEIRQTNVYRYVIE
jgi:ribosomal protein S18 acetylase RimI-like enzyme